jgi:alpha-L-fucosidase
MMGHHAADAWYSHNLVKSLQPDILIVDHEGIESPYDEDLVMYEEPRGVFAPAGNTWAAVQGQKINQHGGNDWFWASNIQGYLSSSFALLIDKEPRDPAGFLVLGGVSAPPW